MKQLTELQKNDLWTVYESAKAVDNSESNREGEHAVLLMTLTKLGISAGSVYAAYKICEKILGW